MERINLKITGMSCGHCVRAVTDALKGVEGVQVEQVNVGSAVVAYDPATVNADAIEAALSDEGYTVTSVEKAA